MAKKKKLVDRARKRSQRWTGEVLYCSFEYESNEVPLHSENDSEQRSMIIHGGIWVNVHKS